MPVHCLKMCFSAFQCYSFVSVFLAWLYRILSPPPTGPLFGLRKLSEFCCKPGFTVVCAESFSRHTHDPTKRDVRCHSVSELIQVCSKVRAIGNILYYCIA